MRAYPLTEDDLENLALIGGAAAFFFALASAMATYAVGTLQNTALSTADPAHIAYWRGTAIPAVVGAIIALVLALALVVLGHNRLKRIKDQTEF